MQFWPFKKKTPPPPLTPEQLRDALIAAGASGSKFKLRTFCKDYKSQISEQAAFICKVPDELQKSDRSIDHYFQALVAAAQCLASDCAAPALWNQLSGNGNPADNPLIQFQEWRDAVPARMEQLEYDALITEVNELIQRAQTLKGGSARQQEAMLIGHLGLLQFHSGHVADSLEPFQKALELCVEINDVEGQYIYLTNLLEAHAYLDDGHALATAEQLLELIKADPARSPEVLRRIQILRQGVPLCRIVCTHEKAPRELELDEITSMGEGAYQFHFKRSRQSLNKVMTLTKQGNQFASTGQHAAALEKYTEAMEVDPHDPDPVYQSALCLLELGAFAKARESYEEVERLAPAWFRCRSDRWLAEGLESGALSVEEFQVVRALEDGALQPKEALNLAEQALNRFPDFAPLQLLCGDLRRDCRDEKGAITVYRRGLELVEEPDLESRILCALAGILPAGAPERKTLVDRAINLKGSLVAHATAKLLSLQ
jgi:tetratricopeptide (TPR) repeat protein